jgi:hypothetical protein
LGSGIVIALCLVGIAALLLWRHRKAGVPGEPESEEE